MAAALVPVAASVAGSLVSRAMAGSGNQPQPGQAAITNPVEAGQIANSYGATQASFKQQQDLLNALQGQHGVQNQSNVYNQLQGVANGTGPNPAQAMLAQQTGQNVANQAAMAAGQRGAAGNVGLMARQAAQAGGNLQQQAVGQGATMQAQQSLNAIGQAGGMATTMANQQQQQTNNNTQSQMGFNQNLMNAQQGTNANAVASQNSVNAGNAAMNLQQQNQGAQLAGNVTGAIGTALGTLATKTPAVTPAPTPDGTQSGSGGGGQRVSALAAGGAVENPQGQQSPQVPAVQPNPPMPSMASLLDAEAQTPAQPITAMSTPVASGAPQYGGTVGHMMAKGGLAKPMYAAGGPVAALVSPGEKYLPPQAVAEVAKGKDPIQMGRTIPGTPKVKGAKNSYANDTVPATLEEGGIVLPRSVTQSKNPHWAAKTFIEGIMAKKARK